jgi:serine/threonine protein kinase
MQDEIETMQLLACKNIARTFEIFQDPQHVYMVNEVYGGGDLTKVEQNARRKGVSVSEDWWRLIFRQCFEALQFMHQQAMMHCDIKEPNLMLRNENYGTPQVVLIDFGVATAMTAKDTGNVSGTPGYMPPETMAQGKWFPGGDVFSMGVAMMQLMTNKVPDEALARQGKMIGIFLEGCTNIEDVKRVTNTRQPPFQLMPKQYPGLTQLCMRCLEKNPRSRPRAPVALKDPWFGQGEAPDMTPVEQRMMPQHPMATVGITDEMLQATPATQAIGDLSAPMPRGGIAPGANY